MIAEECRKLSEQLQEVARAKDRKNVHEQLESIRIQLAEIRDLVLSVTDSLKAISKRTNLVGDLNSAKCLERVRKIREVLQNDPFSITKGRQFKDMKTAFEKFATEGAECAQQTWDHFLPRTRPSVDQNQLFQAEQLNKEYAAKASRLKVVDERARKLAKKPPANEEAMAELETAWESMRQLMLELPDVPADPLVQDFLKAANSSKGASIDLLTQEVRDWLSEKKMAHNYRITNLS